MQSSDAGGDPERSLAGDLNSVPSSTVSRRGKGGRRGRQSQTARKVDGQDAEVFSSKFQRLADDLIGQPVCAPPPSERCSGAAAAPLRAANRSWFAGRASSQRRGVLQNAADADADIVQAAQLRFDLLSSQLLGASDPVAPAADQQCLSPAGHSSAAASERDEQAELEIEADSLSSSARGGRVADSFAFSSEQPADPSESPSSSGATPLSLLSTVSLEDLQFSGMWDALTGVFVLPEGGPGGHPGKVFFCPERVVRPVDSSESAFSHDWRGAVTTGSHLGFSRLSGTVVPWCLCHGEWATQRFSLLRAGASGAVAPCTAPACRHITFVMDQARVLLRSLLITAGFGLREISDSDVYELLIGLRHGVELVDISELQKVSSALLEIEVVRFWHSPFSGGDLYWVNAPVVGKDDPSGVVVKTSKSCRCLSCPGKANMCAHARSCAAVLHHANASRSFRPDDVFLRQVDRFVDDDGVNMRLQGRSWRGRDSHSGPHGTAAKIRSRFSQPYSFNPTPPPPPAQFRPRIPQPPSLMLQPHIRQTDDGARTLSFQATVLRARYSDPSFPYGKYSLTRLSRGSFTCFLVFSCAALPLQACPAPLFHTSEIELCNRSTRTPPLYISSPSPLLHTFPPTPQISYIGEVPLSNLKH